MKQALSIRTRVLAGHRIEICAPELPEEAEVEVTITLLPTPPRRSLAQLMRERPPSDTPQAAESWEQYEQLLQQERDSWER